MEGSSHVAVKVGVEVRNSGDCVINYSFIKIYTNYNKTLFIIIYLFVIHLFLNTLCLIAFIKNGSLEKLEAYT